MLKLSDWILSSSSFNLEKKIFTLFPLIDGETRLHLILWKRFCQMRRVTRIWAFDQFVWSRVWKVHSSNDSNNKMRSSDNCGEPSSQERNSIGLPQASCVLKILQISKNRNREIERAWCCKWFETLLHWLSLFLSSRWKKWYLTVIILMFKIKMKKMKYYSHHLDV